MIYNSIVCLFFLFATLYQSRQYLTMKADSQLEASETATGASSTYTLNLIVCLESFAAALAAAIFWNCLCVCARLMTSVADSIMNGYQSEYSFSFSSNSKKLLPETPVIAMQVYFCKKNYIFEILDISVSWYWPQKEEKTFLCLQSQEADAIN